MQLLLQLFISFLQIGAFSFGGGYAALPLIQEQVVSLHGWLSPAEFTDLITISQMTPGPIAINSATFVGTRIAGMPGAIAATLGCILPSCILVSLLAWAYLKYRRLSLVQETLLALRPAVIAMIASSGLSILATALWPQGLELARGLLSAVCAVNWRGGIIFAGALILLLRFKWSPIRVMVLSGLAETACQIGMRVMQHLAD